MNRHLVKLALIAAGVLLLGQASGQVNEVPMKGLGNDWVKELSLKGHMDWEWIETYTDEVYFATRRELTRDGDVVTMWTRIEYRLPQETGRFRSALSRDQWDCKDRRKANVNTVYFNPIFDAGSNHAYDTQDYRKIDGYFGTQKDWSNLVKHAKDRGIRIILDGVFNHLSSDSPFFDRYGHYATVGACESVSSPFRSWFVFHDVPAGTGEVIHPSNREQDVTWHPRFRNQTVEFPEPISSTRIPGTRVRSRNWMASQTRNGTGSGRIGPRRAARYEPATRGSRIRLTSDGRCPSRSVKRLCAVRLRGPSELSHSTV